MSLFNKTSDTFKPSYIVITFGNLIESLGIKLNTERLSECLAAVPDNLWSAIPAYDKHLALVEVGQPGTWPNTNDAIIKFHFRSLNEPSIERNGIMEANMIDGYYQIADYENEMVIDPETKTPFHPPSAYGQPVSWASYAKTDKLNKKPTPAQLHNAPPISYELLEAPKHMHVSKEEGTKKLAFGNARTWSDITTTGHTYPKNTNVTILAIAHIPLTDKDESVTAAYYMGQLELGDYLQTGRVAWEIGFNHSHLADGHVDWVKREAKPEIARKLKEAALTMEAAINVDPYPNQWKSSYEAFPAPEIYLYKEDILVRELDGRRPTKARFKNEEVEIAGIFTKDDIIYGRPTGSVMAGYWFGIPMDLLTDEIEVFNTTLDLPTRVAMHSHLTPVERYISVPLSRSLNSVWIKRQIDKLKIKE